MIVVKFTVNSEEKIGKLHVSGHSGYDEIGKDIVCSGVTPAVYTTIGLIEKVSAGFKVDIQEEKAIISLEVMDDSDLVQLILVNLLEILEGITKDYPKNVKISKILK